MKLHRGVHKHIFHGKQYHAHVFEGELTVKLHAKNVEVGTSSDRLD